MHATAGIASALLIMLLLGACGSPQGGVPAETAGASPPAGTATGEATDEPEVPCVAGVSEVAGTRDAAAMDAFCTVADLVRHQVFSRAFLPGEAPVPADYAGVEPYLTDAAVRRWDEAVAAWIDRRARWAGDLLSGLVLHDATGEVPDGYVIDPDGPYSLETAVDAPRATSGESGGLSLRVTVTSHLVLDEQADDSDRHSLLPVTREATYTLVPSGPGGGWLLDDWQARDTYGRVRLVTG